MKKLIFVFFLAFTVGFTYTAQAQIFNKLKKKTEEKIKSEGEKRATDKINKGVEKGYDELEGKNDEKKEGENKSKENQQTTEKSTNDQPTVTGSTNNFEAVINSKYDFVPGEKIIFYDDFSSEATGDFPVQWNTTGSGEIVTTNVAEGKWFFITNGNGITTLDEPITLPENYTIEFDVIPQKNAKNSNSKDFSFYIISTTKPKNLMYGVARPGEAGIRFDFGYANYYGAYYMDGTPDLKGIEQQPQLKADQKYRFSFWVQKERIRLYIDQTKLFDLPKAMSKNYKYNMIRFGNGTPLIGNLRIATGRPDMRSKLLTEGKLVSYGIYFDVNKDIVKPESFATIKEIATILQENPAVKIRIVGYTDSDGDDNSNLDLSKRRAAAVKNALVTNFKIEDARIETDGKGEQQPVAPNDSGVNKALNRRVEFIKI